MDVLKAPLELVEALGQSLAQWLGLPHLASHFPTVLCSFATFTLTTKLSSYISPQLSRHYPTLSRRTRGHWDARMTSTLHALVIVYFAFPVLFLKSLDEDRAYGWDERAGTTAAIASGFVWDFLECLWHFEGVGYVVHGLSCLIIYLFSFRPFVAYYNPRFLMWEISTPFLNIHWWLDKTNRTGTYLQFWNGVVFMTLFFVVRLCYGGWQSFQFSQTLWDIRNKAPLPLLLVYGTGNIILQGLNWFWFYKMIVALRKRFAPDAAAAKKA